MDHERLGQSDRAVIVLRKIWAREIKALAEKRPLKSWVYERSALDISRGEVWEKQLEVSLAEG